ncbi:CHC2 zinc finger domain-containing protein, partial [Sphingobium indicum]|uniref:CHC2 zinc finger domain-containing protein n=1 Tax=Sphingobium indicum TaxID=332055 RepID=UPI000562D3F5
MPGAKQSRRQRSAAEADAFQRAVSDARDRHNLSDIVARHTALRKRGGRELVGLCPFHDERTPSFEVNDAKGTYYCHGCGAGGDAITLLMKKDGMPFADAVEWLLGDSLPVVPPEERTRRKEADARETAERIA